MDLHVMIERFERFPGVLRTCTAGLREEDAKWQPPTGAWSVVEVVAHLADEETLDFRTRVRMTLEDPSEPWPGIDPEGWSIEKKYLERELNSEVERFCEARDASLVWLRGIDGAGVNSRGGWDNVYNHPKFGEFRAGDILASWCAHDWLHLRQIAKRLYEMCGRDAGEYSTAYAGEWGI